MIIFKNGLVFEHCFRIFGNSAIGFPGRIRQTAPYKISFMSAYNMSCKCLVGYYRLRYRDYGDVVNYEDCPEHIQDHIDIFIANNDDIKQISRDISIEMLLDTGHTCF